MSTQASLVKSIIAHRVEMRDRLIVSMGGPIDRYTADLKDRVVGMVASDPASGTALRRLDAVLYDSAQQAANLVGYQLHTMARWGISSSVETITAAVPREMLGQIAAKRAADNRTARTGSSLALLLFGDIDRQAAAIADQTVASDGIPPIVRTYRVAGVGLGAVRKTVLGYQSAASVNPDMSPATLSRDLDAILGKNSGLNYDMKRISGTEGLGISERSHRTLWNAIDEVVTGYQTWTQNDDRVRESHRPWHGKKFWKRAVDLFVADDGEELPEFPAAPNCRCWSVPMIAEVLAGTD